MTPQGRTRGRVVGLLTTLGVLVTVVVGFAPTASAQGYVPISGSGSTWSFNALDQWRKNVQQFGIRINFSGTGSTDGRNQFKANQVDFAVSEIPYGLTDGGVRDDPPKDGNFAYMPIVAGGTSLMYNLNIGGKRVTNLRLSGETVTKMFTRKITMWNDPAIAADNPALSLPARQILPVVRSDGSGSTAQFTSYLADQHGGLWDEFCAKAGRKTPCGFTSSFPAYAGIVGQVGSIGVANYVRQAQSDGAITYVEYSYAKNAGFPVAKLLNKSGYFIAPTAQAVAVGLLQAQIDPNDLTQKLQGVYNSSDNRTYPMSSYSYMILPTAVKGNFNELKGKTLSDFAYYFLCEGQQQAERLGFSPLPINLVTAGLKQVERIPGSTKKPTDISKCNNPTFSTNGSNTLAETAPRPPDCDKLGATVQCDATGKAVTKKGAAAAKPTTGAGAVKPGDTAPGAAETPGADKAAADTGEDGEASGEATEEGGDGSGGGASLSAVPVSVDLPQDDGTLLIVVAAVLMVVLVAGPPLVARLMRGKG
ncbi:phosphate ABC transporter substrate-binding protein PstS [Actinokineospora globicatena]|uniref:Phosphate ABC transporter substrate-binding protein PstS n=1 Tax=Actinokineospora globicatena TaxID=103729 RepID=A0A9W6QQ15_9PSEU|nr:phosphate ABC transporter substrate-binding protein PstS [Actinokineospora globicatena]GLW93900.1 phosphate ABC transporter substrate-binding protein PstS [Actinokineospora globicatena]